MLNLNQQNGKEVKKKMKAAENLEFQKMEEFLKKWELITPKYTENSQKIFKKKYFGAKKDPRFWASGISVVMHMKNPLIPAMHFNTRYICTTQNWFGGGMDVTPKNR